jgi:hypothetical protein
MPILSPECDADMIHVDKVLYLTADARLFCGVNLCSLKSMNRAGTDHEDSYHDIPTLDALKVFV